jgi:hypothetical protein
MTSDPPDESDDASDEERAEAAALARALDGAEAGGAEIRAQREAAERIRAASSEGLLGELKARAIARQALLEARPPAVRRGRGRWAAAAGGLAAAALALIVALRIGRPVLPPLPDELTSRSAGLLVPGPFPDGQSAADRLDLVTADRMAALRELKVRAAAGRAR